jgi:ribosomal protein S18 acetylase RimI-like enzyme
MHVGNQTSLRECRFLSGDQFETLYETFTAAFSDYLVPFALTPEQFRNHINLNAVDLDRTAGCFVDERLVGFSLNGFGEWEGKSTVYDAGTGVIPEYRRQGLSEAMFEMMIPIFERDGIEQFLLEVITTNTRAVRLYEKLGFEVSRELSLWQCDDISRPAAEPLTGFDLRHLEQPNWEHLTAFWEAKPSWQNSVVAVNRNRGIKRIIGAFVGEECAGYVVFSTRFGRVAQIAVSPDHRRKGIGTALLNAVKAEIADGFSMQVINIDRSIEGSLDFFRSAGFYERLTQYEMIRALGEQ